MSVLVVDDDSVARKAMAKSLDDSYEVLCAEGGEQAIVMAEKHLPKAILLDVEMPDLNGYEVCQQLKSKGCDLSDIPIIFVSAHDSVERRLKGMEIGAEDFIPKPFEPEFLKAKVDKVLEYRITRDSMSQQLDEANKAAFQALTGSSEFGAAIRFVEKSHSIGTYELLAEQFFKATSQLNLNCSMMIHSDPPQFFTSSLTNPTVSPLEQELMSMLAAKERFNDFGARTQINYPHVSLLIKNMPIEEADRYGRYKDLLPFMIEVANATVHSLNVEKELSSQAHNLSKSFDVVKQTLTQLTDSLQTNQEDVARIMHDMLTELDETIPRMGLDDDQEQYLIKRIDGAVTEANTILDQGANLKGSIGNVIRLLDHLVEQQYMMVDKAIASKASTEEGLIVEGSSGSSDDDIELF